MPLTRGRLLLVALVAGGALLGPAPARPQPAPGATAEERAAAKREGQVTYYTARTTTTANTIARKASEALGIKVNIVRLASTLIFNRAVQEFDAGINAADVIDTSVTDHFVSIVVARVPITELIRAVASSDMANASKDNALPAGLAFPDSR